MGQVLFNCLYALMALIAGVLLFDKRFGIKEREKFNSIAITFFSILLIILFGCRTVAPNTDSSRYISHLNNININQSFKDFGFYYTLKIIHFFTRNGTVLLLILASLYLLPLAAFFRSLPVRNRFLLFFFFVSFFFFMSLGTNVLRQGIGASFLLFGLSRMILKRTKIAYVTFLIAIIFHLSMLLPVIIYFLTRRVKTIRIPLTLFLISSILAVVGFNVNVIIKKVPLLSVIINDRMYWYLLNSNNNQYYKTGFRIDFFIFNLLFAFAGVYFYLKNLHVKTLKDYPRYIYSYLLLSAYFFLMFELPFSDRFGVLSWIFIPLIFLPVLNEKKTHIMSTRMLYFFSLGIYSISVFYFK